MVYMPSPSGAMCLGTQACKSTTYVYTLAYTCTIIKVVPPQFQNFTISDVAYLGLCRRCVGSSSVPSCHCF